MQLAARSVLFAVFCGVVYFGLLFFNLGPLANFLALGVAIVLGSTFVTYSTLGVFVIEPSRESDEALQRGIVEHEVVRANKLAQGLVLDMDAYRDGTEKYITKEEAELRKNINSRVAAAAGKTLIFLGGKVPVWL